jgi:hypothetical protein
VGGWVGTCVCVHAGMERGRQMGGTENELVNLTIMQSPASPARSHASPCCNTHGPHSYDVCVCMCMCVRVCVCVCDTEEEEEEEEGGCVRI